MIYRREIDGLRAVAILPVLLFHAGFTVFSGGYVGVDVFFVISGYLITSIILEEQAAGTFSLLRFYERRARRILPPLFLVMFACLPFAWLWLVPEDLRSFSKSLLYTTFSASNFLFFKESGYFDTAAELKPLLHTWSLGVEEQYYLIFPVFLMISRRLRKSCLFWGLCTIACASLFYSHWGTINKPEAAYFLLPYRFWELLIGALLAIFISFRLGSSSPEIPSMAYDLLSLTGLSLILFSIFYFDEETAFPGISALVPTLGTMLIIAFASMKTQVGRLLGSPVLVSIGLISYSTYLWHQPLFAFVRHRYGGSPDLFVMAILSLLAIGLGYLSWRYVERPFRNRQLVSQKALLASCFVGAIFFLTIGVMGKSKDGLLARLGQQKNEISKEFERVASERKILTRHNECQFSTKGPLSVDEFTKQWDCRTDSMFPNVTPLPVILAGDSHSVDKSVALKLNGFMLRQIGGDGCSLNPRLMKPNCPQIFRHLHAQTKGDGHYEYVVLSNRFKSSELSLDSARETIDYWQGMNKKIIFFTAMPRFTGLQYRAAKGIPIKVDTAIAEYSERKELLAYLESRGVYVVNTRAIFCSITPDCSYRDTDGTLLLIDDDHLSRRGAERFGAQLLKTDSLFQSIVESSLRKSERETY